MFKKVLEYAGEKRRLTYLAGFFMLLGTICSVVPYLFIYQLLKPLLLKQPLSPGYVLWRLAAIAVFSALYGLLYVKGLDLSHNAAYNTLKNLRISLQGKMEQQPLGVIQEKGVGAVKKLFTDDIETIELLLAHALPEGFANLIIPLAIYIAMFFVDWKLALLSLAALPLGILSMGMMYKSGMSKMGAYYGAGQVMNNTIIEYINGMEVVKVFNRSGDSYKRFEHDIINYRDFTLDWFRCCWPWMALYNSIIPTVALVTLPLGAYFVLTGLSTLPDLALVLCMSFGIGSPLLRAMSFVSTLPQINYKIEELEKAMAGTPLQQTEADFTGKNHNIEFENVHFSYDDTEVLHGVSLNIPEGGMTALVGESGSGKSTLAKLLVHFYDISEGSIRLGGQDIRIMSLEALNRQISYVAQEQFLFNTSLLENIRLGDLSATDEQVMAAAEKAQCGEFLSRLPNGIHTMAGDGGKQLSGGERQRISLARAILKDAPVVVLDEATAFMDPENEEKMNRAISEVIKNKTVIVIAHRLQSIIKADRICVMDNGSLIAVGTHSQLLESCEKYQKLWKSAEESAVWGVENTYKGGSRS